MKLVFLVCALALVKSTNADEVCYEDLGCFKDSWPFTSIIRPIPYLPWSPANISTEFWLYTRRNRFFSQSIHYQDESSLTDSNFRAIRPTKFIVHGFISDGGTSWVKDLKSALLDAEDVNVVVVNWEKGANPRFDYGQAVANTRVVGAQIALLVNRMQKLFGILESDVHVIGHSLGAHIGGYAGERLLRMGRITGLDPAGPFYEGTEPIVRLDPTDALYVDAIHTDGQSILELGWGMLEPVGHADFYPNGGMDQPGCPGNEEESGHWWQVTCNHGRACDLMIDSLKNRDFPMVGHPCENYDFYLAGQCDSCSETGCSTLGYYSDVGGHENVQVNYFLTTGSSEPFADES